MRIYLQLLIPLVFTVTAQPAYAGARTQAQDDTQLILTANYYTTDDIYTNKGHTRPQSPYRKYELISYVEYGYSDDITLGTNLSLQQASQSRNGNMLAQNNWGIGDSEFFLRKRLWQQDGFVASIEPLIKLPSPASSSQDRPVLGGSHGDAALGLSGGYGFSAYHLNHFADLDAQYRYRFGQSRDQIKITATTGIHVSEQWMLMPQLFLTRRTSTPAMVTYSQSSGDDYDAMRLQLSAVYAFNPATSLQFGGFGDVSGKNTGQGKGALFALWKRF